MTDKIKKYLGEYIVWYCYDKPMRVYKTARYWWYVNATNPWSWKLVWYNLFHNQPWSSSYMWKTLWYQLNKQHYYFSHAGNHVADIYRKRILSQLDLCIRLIYTIINEDELWDLVPKQGADESESYGDKMEYKCLVKVNTNNVKRFALQGVDINNPNRLIKYYEYMLQEPHLLYIEKAKHLALRIIAEHSEDWID